MRHIATGLAVAVPLAVTYGAIHLARRERSRPARLGRPARNGAILLCAVTIVLALLAGVFAILALP